MAKTIKLNVSEKAVTIIKRNFAKDGQEKAALQALSDSNTKFQETLTKEKENLAKEIAILNLELEEAQRNAVPTQSQIKRAELELEKAQQALQERFELGLNKGTQALAEAAMHGDVHTSMWKTLLRVQMKDQTLDEVSREVAAVKAAQAKLDGMSETSEVLSLRRQIAALTEQIETIDMFLQESGATV